MDFLSPDIAILDNDSFVFSKDESGATVFTQNPEKKDARKYFHLELSIPHGPTGRNTCILRINFSGTNTYITMNAQDRKTGDSLDTTTLAPGTNLHTDIFIPVSSDSRRISIQFRPSYPDHKFSVKNIELWYY